MMQRFPRQGCLRWLHGTIVAESVVPVPLRNREVGKLHARKHQRRDGGDGYRCESGLLHPAHLNRGMKERD